MSQMSKKQACQDIREYLVKGPLAETVVADDDELLVSGQLDSLAVMRLVAFLEMKFDRNIPPEDITVTNLANINAIATYLFPSPS